jgi:microcystin-dependent protein
LSDRSIGERGGSETVTLTETQLPPHRHDLKAVTTVATLKEPAKNLLAKPRFFPGYAPPGETLAVMNDASVSGGGGGQSHSNMPPFVAMNYIIALQGIFPTRE